MSDRTLEVLAYHQCTFPQLVTRQYGFNPQPGFYLIANAMHHDLSKSPLEVA
ncbi:hypothetical protein [Nostoc sp.]|uniref:hypothetical protein n=1 Tax=Nostoc sp. TaxID=1180 RepID=UPI002FFA7DF6